MLCFISHKQKHGKLETALVGRGLEGFKNRAEVEVQSSGITELDAVLGGGFPCGSLVELCGPASSGRTSLAFSMLAQATGRQQVCAFVDVSDSLDPQSLAAAGVELPRLLWIRCGESGGQEPNLRTSAYFAPAEKEAAKTWNPASGSRKPTQRQEWRHPRELMRGVEKVIPSIVGKTTAINEPSIIRATARSAEEQVERDRELPRRGIRPSRVLSVPSSHSTSRMPQQTEPTKPWKRLEQALKAIDQLLQGGGWGVVVFDLGGVPWVDVRRINLSMWFRFRRAVESTPTILLLLGEESCAKSCASVVLRCQRKSDNWSHAAEKIPHRISTFEGYEVEGEVTHSRGLTQPAERAHWQAHTP